MDLRDTPEELQFRLEIRAWLANNIPSEPEPERMPDRFRFMIDWQRRLVDGGWGALSWPAEYGGAGRGPAEEAILSEELGRAKAPTASPLSYLGRPLLQFGSDEQKMTYLPALLRCEQLWCQGFSEPGAGSDLASLQTEAKRQGDTYRIAGQKVWTSFAEFADMCLLLVRTDTEPPNHKGISALIVPMDADGVTVRPITMANGVEEFAEVFFDDVRVPIGNLVGEVGQGWQIAQSTLTYERGAVDIGYQAKFSAYLAALAGSVIEADRQDDPAVRQSLGRALAGLETLRFHCLRTLTARADSQALGPLTSIDKLLMTEVEQTLIEVALSALSPAPMLNAQDPWFGRYLFARAASIYGGTSQIQRTILATRVLGLPRA